METEHIRINIQEVMEEINAKPVENEQDMYVIKRADCTAYINFAFDTIPMPVIIFNVWRSAKAISMVNLNILNDLNNETALGTHSVHNNVYYFRHAMWLTDDTIISAETITNVLHMAQIEAIHGYTLLKTASIDE